VDELVAGFEERRQNGKETGFGAGRHRDLVGGDGGALVCVELCERLTQ
jgi:hypothetical protein